MDRINVTRTLVPETETFLEMVRDILDSRQMTNQGKYAQKFEAALREKLGQPLVTLCSNGTIALQLAIRAAGLNGKKVVTTPFSYVATVSALLWEGCTPVFADIDEETLCLSPEALQRMDLKDIAGLVPVFSYGNACDMESLAAVAADNGLTTIYDAAQALGCSYDGTPLAAWGDYSIISLHATKTAHSVEGGCIVCHTAQAHETLLLLRAFGHRGDEHHCLGINGKMSELHAAMGLCTLPLLEENIQARGKIIAAYDSRLPAKGVRRPAFHPKLAYNNQYYPIIFDSESALLKVVTALNGHNIHPRRYFYPSLTELPYINQKGTCPVAEDVAPRALCLPVYRELREQDCRFIMDVVADCLG